MANTSDAVVPTIPDRGNVDGALRIGYLLPTSGQSASVGPPMAKGIEMAVRDINAAGGVNGEQVTIVGGDEGDDPSIAGVSVDRLLNTEKVDAADRPGVIHDGASGARAHHRRGGAGVLTVEHRAGPRAVPR